MKRSWKLYGGIFICAYHKVTNVIGIQRLQIFPGRVDVLPAENKMRMGFDIILSGAKGAPWPQLF